MGLAHRLTGKGNGRARQGRKSSGTLLEAEGGDGKKGVVGAAPPTTVTSAPAFQTPG